MKRALLCLFGWLALCAPALAQSAQGFNSGGLNTCSVVNNQQLLPNSICYGYILGLPTFFLEQPTGGVFALNFDNFIGSVAHTTPPLSIATNGNVTIARLGLGAGTAASPPLTIPAGVAPTSPANGSIWTDVNGGLYVESSGVTVGPLGAGGSNVTWPTTGDIMLSTGTDTPGGIAPVNGECAIGSGGAWAVGACGGSAAITMSDSFGNSIASASVLEFGPGVLLSGGTPTGIANLNQSDRLVTTCSGTPSPCLITALDMGGQVNFDAASLTVTIPALTSVTPTASVSGTALTLSSGTGVSIGDLVSDAGVHFPAGTIIISGSGTAWVLNKNLGTITSETVTVSFGGSGQSFVVTSYANSLQIASVPGINIYPGGATGTIPAAGGMACVSNGATLDCPGLAAQPNQAFLNQPQTWTGVQTWGPSLSAPNIQSGTTYVLAATDCGGTVIFTNASAVSLTTLGTLSVGCAVAVEQKGAGQVTVLNGSGATLTSAHSYTKTYGQYAVIGLFVDANSGGSTANFNLTGDGA